jgi:hypothetical protein
MGRAPRGDGWLKFARRFGIRQSGAKVRGPLMYTAHQPRVFSRDLVMYDGNIPVARIDHRAFTDTAGIPVRAERFEACRTGWWRPTYTLVARAGIVAEAEATGF